MHIYDATYLPHGHYFTSLTCWLSVLLLTPQLQLLRNHLRWNASLFNSYQINVCVLGIGVFGPVAYSLFRRTRAAQIVVPEGIQTQHFPLCHGC